VKFDPIRLQANRSASGVQQSAKRISEKAEMILQEIPRDVEFINVVDFKLCCVAPNFPRAASKAKA